MATKHTPTPWAYEQSSCAIYYADGDVEPVIAGINQDNTSEEQADADGFHIVRAVNCHDDMLEALKGILSNPGGRCTTEQWQAGLRAIAKAEGRL